MGEDVMFGLFILIFLLFIGFGVKFIFSKTYQTTL